MLQSVSEGPLFSDVSSFSVFGSPALGAKKGAICSEPIFGGAYFALIAAAAAAAAISLMKDQESQITRD